MSPLGSTGAALTGVAGALLTPGLAATAGNLSAGESALGALSAVGEVVLDDLVDDGLVGLDAEDGVVSSMVPTSAPAMFKTLMEDIT